MSFNWLLPPQRDQALRDAEADRIRREPRPLEAESGFKSELLTLSDSDLASTSQGRTVYESGYGLHFRVSGSNPAARLDVECGGLIRHMAPGDSFVGRFTSFRVRNSTNSQSVGTANLLILRRGDVSFREEVNAAGVFAESNCYVNGVEQVGGSTANQPSTATDGASLAGAKYFHALVSAAGTTFDGTGTFRLWFYSLGQNPGWYRGDYEWAAPSGIGGWISPRFDAFPYGRAFLETNGAGLTNPGDIFPVIQSWS